MFVEKKITTNQSQLRKQIKRNFMTPTKLNFSGVKHDVYDFHNIHVKRNNKLLFVRASEVNINESVYTIDGYLMGQRLN